MLREAVAGVSVLAVDLAAALAALPRRQLAQSPFVLMHIRRRYDALCPTIYRHRNAAGRFFRPRTEQHCWNWSVDLRQQRRVLRPPAAGDSLTVCETLKGPWINKENAHTQWVVRVSAARRSRVD